MANIKVCDKCGEIVLRKKFEDAPDVHLQVRDISGDYGKLEKDLCDVCMIDFQKLTVDFFGAVEVNLIEQKNENI